MGHVCYFLATVLLLSIIVMLCIHLPACCVCVSIYSFVNLNAVLSHVWSVLDYIKQSVIICYDMVLHEIIVQDRETNAGMALIVLVFVAAWISRWRKKAGVVVELVRSSLCLQEYLTWLSSNHRAGFLLLQLVQACPVIPVSFLL